MRGDRAVTLVEMLAVIAVLAVALAVLIPAISGTRDKRSEIKSLANARTLATFLTTYAVDHKERYLSREGVRPFDHFAVSVFWSRSIGDGYIADSEAAALHSGAYVGTTVYSTKYTDFQYACSFLASPEYYEHTGRLGEPLSQSQLRGALMSDVRFPSLKAILSDMLIYSISRKEAIYTSAVWNGHPAWVGAFADNSAFRYKQLKPGYFDGDGSSTGLHTWSLDNGMHTISGVHGADKM